MVGSPVIGGIIAQIAFWALLLRGVLGGELTWPAAGGFVALWAAAEVGLPHVAPTGGLFITPVVAVLDIALVFIVFKSDVRLS
ncbi:MAG TPA: hypothetical protein VFZ98_04120 [Vicinamibacterales bacterium]